MIFLAFISAVTILKIVGIVLLLLALFIIASGRDLWLSWIIGIILIIIGASSLTYAFVCMKK